LANAVCWFDLGTVRDAASASVVGMVDRLPMMLSFEAASVGRPIALRPLGVHTGFRSRRLTSSSGNVGAFQPRLQRSPADFTGCVTGVRYQELGFSAFVLSTTIALDDCRHFRNMRLRRAGSSQMVRCKQK
jgi:hypothetical protein